MQDVEIKFGQRFQMLMPYGETCVNEGIAGQVMEAELTGDVNRPTVNLFRDGAKFCSASFREFAFYFDDLQIHFTGPFEKISSCPAHKIYQTLCYYRPCGSQDVEPIVHDWMVHFFGEDGKEIVDLRTVVEAENYKEAERMAEGLEANRLSYVDWYEVFSVW